MRPKKKSHRRPDGAIRRSQVLTRAGPGAVVDLVDHAVMIKGLDAWSYRDDHEGWIEEPRLAEQVLSALRATGEWNHAHVRLRWPPRCEDDDAGPWRGMHAREFPSWYLCRRCKGLVRRGGLGDNGLHICVHEGKASGAVVPIRFVAGCPRGHIQDIYWRYFVHAGEREEGVPEDSPFFCTEDYERGDQFDSDGEKYVADMAMLTTGTSGELSDMIVLCRRCGRTRSLQALRQPMALGTCQGWRPWLSSNDDQCDEPNKLLIRTGSNVWFSRSLSVLSIPEDSDNDVDALVERLWDKLKKVESLNDLSNLMNLLDDVEQACEGFERGEILDAIRRKRAGVEGVRPSIRESEWNTLMNATVGLDHDLPPREAQWFARRLDVDLPDYLDRVVLVHSLREVRALFGFTRIEGTSVGPEGEADAAGPGTAPLSEYEDWVPAVELQGEGIFLAFDEEAVREWEDREAVQDREEQFREGLRIENAAKDREQDVRRFTSARLIMLHSLAHMLITQISVECGYSAAAIRERIYCFRTDDEPERSRAGILLYTGTPGSEGTLGGLVEVGRDIVRHIDEALRRGHVCSNDPICAQHRPDGPEDGRRREGAACHGCLLIAEPSCERMNNDLDRAFVVETMEELGASFLGV